MSRISAIILDDKSVVRRTRAIEQEREVAIYDLLEANQFKLEGSDGGPYRLTLSVEESRLALDIAVDDGSEAGVPHAKIMLSLSPLRGLIRDYFLVCESYYKAIRTAPPSQIEALDMGRKALHDEGAELLRARLAPRVECDFDTARRLFTLICVLHLKG
jgi:uncharacterized protein (UPF0262 family)